VRGRYVRLLTALRRRSDVASIRCTPVREAYMRNRTLFAAAIIAVAAAVIATVLGGPAIGPQVSRADRQPATVSWPPPG
jgi:hypothetical protein